MGVQASQYWQVKFQENVPDFGAGEQDDELTPYSIVQESEIIGQPKVGAEAVLSTTRPEQINQHLEGCELRELQWFNGKTVTVICQWDMDNWQPFGQPS